MSLTKDDLQRSIIIVIQQDGTHMVKLPSDESLDFSPKAYTDMVNTLAVIGEPSYFILAMLWLERKMQYLSSLFSR